MKRSYSERGSVTVSAGTPSVATPTHTSVLNRSYPFVRELALLITAALVYAIVRRITQGGPSISIANGQRIWEAEQQLGINFEPALQSFVLAHEAIRDAANWIYIFGHWPVIIGCAILLAWRCPQQYRTLRSAILLSGAFSFLLFALYPCAPPRLADVGIVDSVTRWSSSYRILQPPQYTNIYAAMPSLHFGWDLLVAITVFGATRNWLIRAAAVCIPLAMAFAVVATANHYIIDVLVAAVIVLTSLYAVRRYERARDLSS